jgi:polyketide synthase PksM
MDELLGRLLWRQLVAVGWFDGGVGDFSSVTARVRPARHVARWLEASLAMLDELGVVRYTGGRCTGRVEDADALWAEWERTKGTWFADASVRPRLVIAEAMLRSLPEVLRGEKLPTDLIFPGGSMDQVRAVYQGNPLADFFNAWTTDVVVAYVEERLAADPDVRLRLLEVGAGTGSTSAEVFRKLTPYRHAIAEYCYTDLSRAFLQHAETTYGPDNPYLSYRLLDIERSPGEQDFDLGSYDLVVAANVLHATRRIGVTVDNVKTLMRPDALLVLNEMAGINLLTHAAFGLLEGWWLHEDPELRIAGSPALESEVWQGVLERQASGRCSSPSRSPTTWAARSWWRRATASSGAGRGQLPRPRKGAVPSRRRRARIRTRPGTWSTPSTTDCARNSPTRSRCRWPTSTRTWPSATTGSTRSWASSSCSG